MWQSICAEKKPGADLVQPQAPDVDGWPWLEAKKPVDEAPAHHQEHGSQE